jgi:hypothetical protein
MTSRRATPAVLLLLPLLLAGCGDDPTPVARDPAPTTPTAAEPTPHWAARGCDERSGINVDYTSDAVGADTLDEALAPYVPDGATIVKKPAGPHRNAQYLAVNDHHEIVAAVEAVWGEGGWLVYSAEKCVS